MHLEAEGIVEEHPSSLMTTMANVPEPFLPKESHTASRASASSSSAC